ncbi:50S ribosomal protein L3 [Labeo rohita]|uniref:50S ribosomal protein L3 n=1 Tax=Labeo rohita TaxID=84645 RepID=A0ABQ8L7T6_LABRO|nr:50S ribosomal protein L3 [Labeo rohita]
MGKSQSKFGKYDTLTFAQMRKSAGEKCMLDIEKLIKYHEFPREGTLSVAKLKAVKKSVKEGSKVPRRCCARHVCKECEATVNCWLREAERRERKALQKAMAGSKIKTEEKQTEKEKNGEKINEMLKELMISEDKIREIKEGKALALITCTNLSDVSVSEHVPPPYHHYPMAELQALRVDPDLDCSPPRKPTAPPPPAAAAAAAAQWVTQPTAPEERLPATRPKSLILQRKRAREDRLNEEEEDYADVPETPLFDNKDEEEELMMRRTPQMKRKRPLARLTVKREERNVTAPMIEVSGPDGPMMVFRPWTALEAREAMAHLPDVSEGGDKMSTELVRFCEEFSPTMTELRRLLLSKLGPSNWYKISNRMPADNHRRKCSDWNDDDNDGYRRAVETEKDETVDDYYCRLHEVFNKFSGLTEPARRGEEPGTLESHLRNAFLDGRKPEITEKVKVSCMEWREGRLATVLIHARHADGLLRKKREKKPGQE